MTSLARSSFWTQVAVVRSAARQETEGHVRVSPQGGHRQVRMELLLVLAYGDLVVIRTPELGRVRGGDRDAGRTEAREWLNELCQAGRGLAERPGRAPEQRQSGASQSAHFNEVSPGLHNLVLSFGHISRAFTRLLLDLSSTSLAGGTDDRVFYHPCRAETPYVVSYLASEGFQRSIWFEGA